MHERRDIRLSAADRCKLGAVVRAKSTFWRAKIILLTTDGCGTAEILLATGTAKTGFSIGRSRKCSVAHPQQIVLFVHFDHASSL
jgi:hypothetical protein